MTFMETAFVQVAFNKNPFDTLALLDYSTLPNAIDIQIRRGRTHELSRFEAGQATVTLDDRDRRYDPTFTGPYGANLVPMKQVRVVAGLNLLTEQTASLELTTAVPWIATTNCSVSRTTAQALDGTHSLQMSSTASGSMFSDSHSGPGIPVVGGATYTAMAWFRSAATSRSVHVEMRFYDASGAGISTLAGSSVATTTTVWTQATLVVSAPSNAAWAGMVLAVSSTAGASEIHYVDQMGIFSGSDSTNPWSRGSYNTIFTGYVESWEGKRSSEVDSDAVMVAVDLFKPLNYKLLRSKEFFNFTKGLNPTNYWRLDENATLTGATISNYFVDQQANRNLDLVRTPGFNEPGPIVNDPSPGIVMSPDKGGMTYSGATNPLGTQLAFSVAFWLKTSVTPPSASFNPFLALANIGIPVVFGSVSASTGLATFFVAIDALTDGSQKAVCICAVMDGSGGGSSGTNWVQIHTQKSTVINDGKWHHIVYTRDGSANFTCYVDGVGVSVSGGQNTIAPTSTTTTAFGLNGPGGGDIAIKDMTWWNGQVVSATNVLALYNTGVFAEGACDLRLGHCMDIAGMSSGLRSFSSGNGVRRYTDSLVQTSALDHMQLCVDSTFGVMFVNAFGVLVFNEFGHTYSSPQATLSDMNGTGEIPYQADSNPIIDDVDVYNEISISGPACGAALTTDSTSITTYGNRTFTLTSESNTNADIQTFASTVLTRYKTPTPRVRQVIFEPRSSPTNAYSVATAIELLSKVTYKLGGVGGGTTSTDFFVEGITHDIKPSGTANWRVTYALSPF